MNRIVCAALAAVLTLAALSPAVALADEGYRVLSDWTVYRAGISSDDSLDLSGGEVATGTIFETRGNATLAVGGVFTVSTASVTVHAIGWNRDEDEGHQIDQATLAAGSVQPDGTEYDGERWVLFDTFGIEKVELRVSGITSPAEGEVDLRAHVYGLDTQAGGQ